MLFGLAVALILFGVIFNSFYKLSESPVTWTDEGLIIQTSQNLAGQGIYGFQIAPKTFISPSFISTSYPVTFPIALSFHLFGITLLNARLVMALYIIALASVIFIFFRDKVKEQTLWALILIATFPPLYGHGKNILGEIPGLFFIMTSAIFLKSIEKSKNNLLNWSLFGLFFGLAVVTKPIFILAVPAFLFIIYKTYINDKSLDLKKFGVLFISSFFPVLLWFFVQFFRTDTWFSILGYYGNPYSYKIFPAIVLNLKDFVSHGQTLFAGGIFLIWSFSLAYSYCKNKHISLSETYLYILSFFVFAFYFRDPPYYRYFLISEILSLVFLSFNLFSIIQNKIWQRNLIRVFLLLLVVFQLHELYFNSWVASSYASTKTATMENTIGKITPDKTVFFYQAPEAVVFLKNFNYYQYFSGTTATEFGEVNLHLVKDRKDLLVLTRKDLFLQKPDLFSGYYIIREFDRYVLAAK